MKFRFLLLLFTFYVLLLASCGPSPEQQATMTATARTATANAWTRTFTTTFTTTYTLTASSTPTETFTPTITDTPTITFTPTYNFPKVRVNVANLSCRYGPAAAYLFKYTLHEGDTGVVWGRYANSVWLYVKMDTQEDPCWTHPFYLDIEGDITKILYQQINLPITNALYGPPQWVEAERDGNTVTVSWQEVWMTEDDDRGYFLDVWVCQGGNPVWLPVAMPNQYQTQTTFIDEPGCSQPSGGKLYTVEKHGYTSPVIIPWPPAQP